MAAFTTHWGSPAAALAAMRAGCWDLDADLAGLQSALARDAGGGREVVRAERVAPDLAIEVLRNALDVEGRAIRVVMALSSPRVLLLDGLLDAGECEALIEAARPRLVRSATVGDDSDLVSEARTSRDAALAHEAGDVSDRLDRRLHALFDWPREAGERLQVVHYGPGEEFQPHHDFFVPGAREAGASRQRVATVICYLNDPVCGGHTAFPDLGLRVVPRRGAALFFNYEQPSHRTRTLHAGLPVLEGAKWIATKWFTCA